jgi:hypothetical protein
MRWCWVTLTLVGCTCSTNERVERPISTAEGTSPLKTPREVLGDPPQPQRVAASWLERQLTPQRTDLTARIDYGPTTSTLTVQLELPPGVQVTQGRTFLTLEPTSQAKTHLEPVTLVTQALPVRDLVLVITGPGLTIREPFRFGRRP